MTQEITAPNEARHLSDFMSELPDHCLFDKGITGCGGTTVELTAKHNSVIAVPTRNLALSKQAEDNFVFIGKVRDTDLTAYLNSDIKYKKILVTYDRLPYLTERINPNEWTLLVDEYHLLFNDYSFRNDAVQGVLHYYNEYPHWCFMTATPISQDVILKELGNIDRVKLVWPNATAVNLHIMDTTQVIKKLLLMMENDKRNLHIFLNSVKTISTVVEELETKDFRVVCSGKNASKIEGYALPTSPVKRYNFYTSCAFEGVDIYDSDGVCVIVSDTKIATTLIDISTKVRQVCGRLRDSKYKDECYFILNTRKHRYAGVSKQIFANRVAESEELGQLKQKSYDETYTPNLMKAECKIYGETFTSLYLNKYNDKVFYDPNMKTIDEYNYRLVSEIYTSSISVLTECQRQNGIQPNSCKIVISDKGLHWVRKWLLRQTKQEYTFEELDEIFRPMFKEHSICWNNNNSIKLYFPKFEKSRRKFNGMVKTVYKFIL